MEALPICAPAANLGLPRSDMSTAPASPFFCAQNFDGVKTPLQTDIDISGLEDTRNEVAFPLRRNRYMRQFHAVKADDKRSRRGLKRLVKPENAAELTEHLPEPGDCTHALVRGDFVMGDIIPLILGDRSAEIVAISTLGMSRANAAMLADLRASGQIRRLFLLVSHYFSQVDKTGTYREVKGLLGNAVKVARTHAKVILVSAPPSFFVVEGSANLRSSDNIEQFAIWNDEELLNWHLDWMQEVANA